ncbi:MAG: hypothetical protein M1816_005863 [Peltula sp. TS41687]|nr:MAG: hypothetical protein M1816_005863 [Peltula sp. TS41687]
MTALLSPENAHIAEAASINHHCVQLIGKEIITGNQKQLGKMVSWATLKTLLFTLGPLLLPKLLTLIASIRRSSSTHPNAPASTRPIPLQPKRALNILFVSALLSLLSTLPIPPLQPRNIFHQTSSRLQIPTDVLFTRLSSLHRLTASDQLLKSKLTSLDSRLLYLTHGPDPLIHCAFCTPEHPKTHLYYSLPAILTPHLAHIAALGLATSSLLAGPDAATWRTQATVAGVALAAAEVWARATYDVRANARATRVAELDAFHWRVLVLRGVAFAVVDMVLAGVVWLTATNRAWGWRRPEGAEERLERVVAGLERTGKTLQAVGIVRNAVLRSEGLSAVARNYWVREGRVLREVFEEEDEVRDAQRRVLERVHLGPVEWEAGRYVEELVAGGRGVRVDGDVVVGEEGGLK